MTTMYDRAIRCVIVCLATLPWLGSARAAGGETGQQKTSAPPRALVGCCIINAVPAPECIPSIEEVDCLAMGGVPIDNVTCDDAPCDLGSCCLEAGVCDDHDSAGISHEDCGFLGGNYYGGLRCIADDPCPTCAIDNQDHCQQYDGSYIFQSDRMLGVRRADDFTATASGPINRVCWWPCWFNPNAGTECSAEGDKPPDDFIVRFYADAGGIPGYELGIPGGQALTPDATSPIDGDRCWNYSAPVITPPVVTAGECYWIEITGHGDNATGCTVYWANNNSSGNSYSMKDSDGVYTGDDIQTTAGDEAADLAFCVDAGIEPGGCTHVAACCLPDLTCQDNTPFADCVAAAGVFKPAEVCGPDTCPIPCDNDDCVTAIDLNGPDYCNGGHLPCSFDFTNEFCEPRASATACQLTPGGPIDSTDIGSDKWYTWNPSWSGEVNISMCNAAAFDAVIAVYEGGTDCSVCPDEAAPMVCGDDTCGVGGGPPEVTIYAESCACYFIRIGGWNGEQGSGRVILQTWACPPRASRPWPDARFGLDASGQDTTRACTGPADCLEGLPAGSEVDCIPFSPLCGPEGMCYVRQNRYLSIDPNPYNWLTARRVSLDLGDGQQTVLGWMEAPISVNVAGNESSPQWMSRIVDAPVYLDWGEFGSVHLGDCEIAPGRTYLVEAITDYDNPANPYDYSRPLVLSTAGSFGDVVGATGGDPPDGVRNF